MNKMLLAVMLIAAVSANGTMHEFLTPLGVGQQCSNPINAYTVTQFDVVPFPPTKGSKVVTTSVGTFTQAETITGIQVTVTLNGRHFYEEVVPESGSYTSGQVGTFVYDQSVPSIAPKGAYVISGGLINSSKQQISCWEVSFNL